MNIIILVYFVYIGIFAVQIVHAMEKNVGAHVGTTVALPCMVDTDQCGALHSIKWYRDNSRIYVFSHVNGIARAEGDSANRMTVEYSEAGGDAHLKIDPVEILDEATYKCEITYLEVRENCDVVQLVKLQTLVIPSSVRILDTKGTSITNSSVFGPNDEGSEIELICEAIDGKPTPKITWYNNSKEINSATYSSHENTDGTGTGTSKLQVILSKGDLNAQYQCRVESDALAEPILSWIIADVHVRPSRIELNGKNRTVISGQTVTLTCDVHGARPAANISWANMTVPINDRQHTIKTQQQENSDGTFSSTSELEFEATRFDNGKMFQCYAQNEVTINRNEPNIYDVLLLTVQYPPSITVSPLHIVTNESSDIVLFCHYIANPQKLISVVWSKNGQNLTIDDERYEGGTTESPHLRIRKVTRNDMGNYTCSLKNSIGMEQSNDSIFVNVYYTPTVEILMEPTSPIKAVDRENVTLLCNVTSGNPSTLLKVKWSLGGVELKELPECNYTIMDKEGNSTGGPLCGIDPSILSLERVEDSFAGNYTCQGENIAGWGPIAEAKELIVHYPPSPAKLRYYPSRVVKKASVTLECTVDHTGRPDNVSYIWYRGSHLMSEVISSNWTINPVTLETKSNFTCIAQNDGGQSEPYTTYINVSAPPAFIQNLVSYQGILFSSKNISLTCRVECSPLCSIIWFKDGQPLDVNNNPLYYIKTSVYPPDLRKNDFESIESTLHWNLTAWPDNQLDKSAPNSNYTCQSYANGIGPGVSSNAEIAVHYPPDDVLVSQHLINVEEGNIPQPVQCKGKGNPTVQYIWRGNSTIYRGPELRLNKMYRSDTGTYICEASNKHGIQQKKVYFNVQYAPMCSIDLTKVEGNLALVCSVQANPQEVTFIWKMLEENETSIIVSTNVIQEGLKSYLILDSGIDSSRTYYCYANNSVGESVPCERDVAGNLPWWKRLNDEKTIVIIASSIAMIICVLIVCIIIILLCRRKRANTKLPSSGSGGDKNNLENAQRVRPNNADPSSDPDKGFYENLPFHGMQNPPNKPYRPELGDLIYADMDSHNYGPINYKAASIYAATKRNKNNKMEEEKRNNGDLL